MKGALLVAGTTSDAGKSVLVAGICRMLARRGVRVAPFKAQNMSNNSVVTLDGGEIGRAQALQARACGLEPSVRFNPVLLKPGSDRRSQLVVRGKAVDTIGAGDYFRHRQWLRGVVADELAALRAEFDVVICEGAGSPAEINLRATDLANMGLARAADLPVLIVGDIDRGGVLAHLFGTLAILEPEDQQLISGFVINKFRGDVELLRPGLDQLTARTGRPTLGVIPYSDELWIDAEDSLGTVADAPVGRPRPPIGSEWLTVAAVRLPRISNSTDVEALACEPGVSVRWVTEPSRLSGADLVVLPGSKATVDDLRWLRRTGLADALLARAAAGGPIFGICGGYQMLGSRIIDEVESGAGTVDGLGLLDLEVEFGAPKVVRRVVGVGAAAPGIALHGYEIHHGRVRRTGERHWLRLTPDERREPAGTSPEYDDHPLPGHRNDPVPRESAALGAGTTAAGSGPDGEPGRNDALTPGVPEGSVRGTVWGTHVHGLMESDEFRRAWLAEIAAQAGRTGFRVASGTSVAAVRLAQLDLLADLVEQHLDLDALDRLLVGGAPRDLPAVTATRNDAARLTP
ncbi:cobyric acid synthase [Nocardia cyriacigeorgica]|uniref:cobyric acid synthase n=1 Tax=Nocardia cyriacigeorgica TaxID=135487 RepID=UPI0018956067|nr:cobyric acid synthase [Nocardia cyriacigeorgica]MBF6456921.1 cobyric acid synthase [Nocardia cyriacigeorgica]MBF6477310.1 cobyric acid synthase [Nocardia cyriacigeorgica]MBF6551726.1 cobyric acid synthase [Nocardia cyriacigeorgica]